MFDAFVKPFPPREPWLDTSQVVGDASPGFVSLTNLTLVNWTADGCGSAVGANPTAVDLESVQQASHLDSTCLHCTPSHFLPLAPSPKSPAADRVPASSKSLEVRTLLQEAIHVF